MLQYLVDAFASAPFKGNPAAVVEPFEQWPCDDFLQNLAMENNQAETAYLLKTDKPDVYGLRWFTPGTEVKLCGHATLASAHILFTTFGVTAEVIHFDTLSGRLSVRRIGDLLEMDFPALASHETEDVPELEALLGQKPVATYDGPALVVQLADEACVRNLKLSPGLIPYPRASTLYDGAHLIVTALADPGSPYDVVSRFFAPGLGVDEDPTTGSMHCVLIPLYSALTGKRVLDYHQAYPRRGGDLQGELVRDRVLIRGRAVTVQKTELLLTDAAFAHDSMAEAV